MEKCEQASNTHNNVSRLFAKANEREREGGGGQVGEMTRFLLLKASFIWDNIVVHVHLQLAGWCTCIFQPIFSHPSSLVILSKSTKTDTLLHTCCKYSNTQILKYPLNVSSCIIRETNETSSCIIIYMHCTYYVAN